MPPPVPKPPMPQEENPFKVSEDLNRLIEMMKKKEAPPEAPRTLSGGIEDIMMKLSEKMQPAVQSLQEQADMHRRAREENERIWREQTEFPGFTPAFEHPNEAVENAPGFGPPLPAWWGKNPQAMMTAPPNPQGHLMGVPTGNLSNLANLSQISGMA